MPRHAAYRCTLEAPTRWRGRVIGDELVADGAGLPQARRALRERLLARSGGWEPGGLVEHVEHDLGDGLWLREALDDRSLDRDHTSGVVLEALGDHRLRAELAGLPEDSAGGVVVVSCAPGDRVDWLVQQHDGREALVVCAAVTNHRLWWNALATAESGAVPTAGGLAELDLAEPGATVDEWMAAVDCGRLVTRAPTASPTG